MSREVRRVPLDFEWPLNKVWTGYLTPEALYGDKCQACDGRGESPQAKHMHDLWYGYVPFRPEDNGLEPLTGAHPAVNEFATRNVDNAPEFYIGWWWGPDIPHADVERQAAINIECRRLARLWNGMWMHHLSQYEVDILLDSERGLRDLTHTFVKGEGWQPKDPPVRPTANEVNAWGIRNSLFGIGSSELGVLMTHYAERDGFPLECEDCQGEGTHESYPGQRADYDAWEPEQPPAGEGWQLWETTSEGSPVGPVFNSSEELAQWLTTDEGGEAVGFGSSTEPMTLGGARRFVGAGWAPSMIGDGQRVYAGVEIYENEDER